MEEFIKNINLQFLSFVTKYDVNEWSITRKIFHSFNVAENCFNLACNLKLDINKRKMAYAIGLLHDIGRFEQWKKYKTFNDYKSVDHGDLSYNLLKNNTFPVLNSFSDEDKNIIMFAIQQHTKPDKDLDKTNKFFCNLIKGADAFSNVIIASMGAHVFFYNKDGFTKQIVDAFLNQQPLYKFSIEKKGDRVLNFLANTYYVRFDYFKKQISNNKYFDIILDIYSKMLSKEDQTYLKQIIDIYKHKYKI